MTEPTITESNGNYALEINSVRIVFDEINSTGKGYWELKHDGTEVATITSIEDWNSETVQQFRAVQFGEVEA